MEDEEEKMLQEVLRKSEAEEIERQKEIEQEIIRSWSSSESSDREEDSGSAKPEKVMSPPKKK